MGGKSGGSSKPKTVDPFPYTQPDVFYDPQAGMYYALTTTGKGRNQKTQRTTNFSMIPILNQEAMKAQSASFGNLSGATFTTDAYKQALSSAMSKLG